MGTVRPPQQSHQSRLGCVSPRGSRTQSGSQGATPQCERRPTSPAAALLLAAILLAAAAPASAEWRLYASGQVGYSVGHGAHQGTSSAILPPVALSGHDTDTSPLIGGAVGLAVPLGEISPWDLPWNLRLPGFALRLETEGVGLRSYQLRTPGLVPGGTPDFHTETESWSILQNLWFDVPLHSLYRGVAWVSPRVRGPARLPKVERFLTDSSLYLGGGLGVARIRSETTEGNLFARGSRFNFAYQLGAGYNYRVTDHVSLGAAYRFIDMGTVSATLFDRTTVRGHVDMDTHAHEFRFTTRFHFYTLPHPWR